MSKSESEAGKTKRLVKHSALKVLQISSLQIDPTYQRDVKSGWKRIMNEFDEASLGIPVIGERADGSLWIVDGQQRIYALTKMGRSSVRAEVFRSEGVEHEARVFKRINLNRVKLNPREQFRALLAAHDPIAWAVKDTVESVPPYKLTLTRVNRAETGADKIIAINTLMNMYQTERIGPDGIKFTLRAIHAAWAGDVQGVHAFLLEAIATFWGSFEGTMDEERMIERMKTVTPQRLLYSAGQQAVGMDKRSTLQVILARLYNKRSTGRRQA